MLKFEDVEYFFSVSTVKEAYEKPNNLKFGLRMLVGVFFSFGSIAGLLGAKVVFPQIRIWQSH